MLLTVERCISVAYPMKARIICTGKRILAALTVTVILIFALNAHILVFRQFDGVYCAWVPYIYQLFWFGPWYWIDSIIYMGIPFIAIVICNAIILSKVLQSQLQRAKLKCSNEEYAKGARLTSTTYMLITVSIMFLVLTLPQSSYYIMRGFQPVIIWDPQEAANVGLFSVIVFLIAFANNTINFLLYCISGRQFRKEFINMITRQRLN